MIQRWLALLVLLMVWPLTGQEESGTYFALTANRTFAPGEKPRIQMWSQGVKSLEFRLYRVEKAGEFLSQLRDAHSFGGQVDDLPKDDTILSRVARTKRSLRVKWTLFLRSQFSQQARAEWRGQPIAEPTQQATKKSVVKGTTYAAIPVLNDKQLIRTWNEAVTTKERWDEQPVDVPLSESGLYLLEATDGKLRAYTLLSMSAMAVITKTQPGHVVTRVLDRATGRGQGGVDIEFRSHKTLHATAKTDAQGFARMDGTGAEDIFVIATRGRDVSLDAISEYAFSSDQERSVRTYAYTDRPIYRPGHKVYFKALFRNPAEFGYSLPSFRDVNAEILDGQGKTVLRKELSLSKFGSVNGEYELPVTAALGYYNIKYTSGKMEAYSSFQVEEYKKPEYEVKFRAAKTRIVQGERVEATISARYYFGEPVKGAKVTYTVRRAPYYPPWWERDELSYEETEEDESGGDFFRGEQGEEIQGRLDDNGELKVQLPTPVIERDYLFRLEARVMDEGNREVTGYGMVIATRGNYSVRVQPNRYVVDPGSTASFEVSLADYDLKPVSGEFRTELHQINWEESTRQTKIIETRPGRVGPDGKARVEFRIPSSGSYEVVAISRSPEGRDLKGDTWIWASGGMGDSGPDTNTVKMIPDKKSYAPGETAKVMILTSEPNLDLWVTTESRTVIDSRAVPAAAAGGVIVDIPIRAEFQPKVFVTVNYIQGGTLHSGMVALKVPPVEKELKVSLKPTKLEFKPGEPARYDVQISDHKGAPVQAELSLGVVDEALYAVQKDMMQTPLSYFYGNTYNEVSTSNSLSYYFRGEAGKRALRLARIRPTLGQLKPERVGDPRVRKAFPDTAFWKADIVTDAQGKGSVQFSFPDALTTWRATARAFTADTRVGAVLDRVIVRKNLMLRTVLPRFLMEGDTVNIGVIVQNYLTSAKEAKVTLAATGVDIQGSNTQTVTVASKGTAKVEFRVKVRPGEQAVFTAKAITDEESDAVEIPLPVQSYGTLLSKGASGSLTGKESASTTLEAPGNGNRKVEVRVAPSLAGSLFGALEYLTEFPYGCTEQTLSSFVPNVVVKQALDSLGIASRVDPADLAKKVNAGLERLYDFQHEDGGWGWWKGDESHPFLTAHVLIGLKQARAAGYGITPESIQRGETWLRREFERQKEARADLRAYMAYALGGKKEIETAFAARPRLTSYGLAFLGLALDEAKDPRALEIAKALEAAATQTGADVYWPGNRDPLLDFDMDTSPEITSHAVKLLSRVRKDSPVLPKAVQWLVQHRNQGQWWNSTKQTAMVIYGVTDYLKVSGELKPDINVTVRVNGKTVLEKDFKDADALKAADFVATVDAADSNQIDVQVSGAGRVYWNAQTRYYTPAENRTAPGMGAVDISREYFRLVPRESGGTTTYAMEPLAGDIKPGDTIAVLLKVKANDWKYVLIEDPIPSGMELVTKDENINLSGKPTWWRYSWTAREYRDNKVAFFKTYFWDSTEQYFYVLKAVNPGQFRVPPTRVQPMYEPEKVATGKAATMEVLP